VLEAEIKDLREKLSYADRYLPGRRERILEMMAEVWEKAEPGLHFGQIFSDFRRSDWPFYLPDVQLEKLLRHATGRTDKDSKS
jgi:hypothetical protein